LWVNGLTAFSVKPLRIASAFGLIVSFIGFLALIYTIVDRFINPDMPAGYSAMMSALLIIGGILIAMYLPMFDMVGAIS
jgi:undecaprenyl-phosphate 4-deoxy-4-formamido-L-arabinose transferase